MTTKHTVAVSSSSAIGHSVTRPVIGHVGEFLNHLGIAEIARSGIACAAERNRADVALFPRCRSDLALRRSCSGTPTATLG